jgi:hypothetical protein
MYKTTYDIRFFNANENLPRYLQRYTTVGVIFLTKNPVSNKKFCFLYGIFSEDFGIIGGGYEYNINTYLREGQYIIGYNIA